MSALDEKGLPSNVDAERFVLGSILLDDTLYVAAAGALEANDFSLEKHRRIFARMGDLHKAAKTIDRVTMANELMKFGQLEACDGLSYLVHLDDGLPQIPNIDSYIRIVRDKATLRSIIFATQHLQGRALSGEEEPEQILAGAGATFLSLAERGTESTLQTPGQIIDTGGGMSVYLDRKNRSKGTHSGYSSLDVMMEIGRAHV